MTYWNTVLPCRLVFKFFYFFVEGFLLPVKILGIIIFHSFCWCLFQWKQSFLWNFVFYLFAEKTSRGLFRLSSRLHLTVCRLFGLDDESCFFANSSKNCIWPFNGSFVVLCSACTLLIQCSCSIYYRYLPVGSLTLFARNRSSECQKRDNYIQPTV